MLDRVVILGSGLRIGAPNLDSIDRAVQEAIDDALQAAQIGLDEIDMVLTIGSDILDGAMVATRSGIAGSYSRQIMTVPSSAGHGLAAALSMIESGAVANVLLVGWGEGTKFAALDGRIIQADPFYARPVGADAVALAALQAQRLTAEGRIDADTAARYGNVMRARAKAANAYKGVGQWLATQWCDGACALVLAPQNGAKSKVAVHDFGSSFEPYCPAPDRLDPAGWVRSAIAAMRDGSILSGAAVRVLEIGGPTPLCEYAALPGVTTKDWDTKDIALNASGGGAVAFFGPATGLHRIIAAADGLTGTTSGSVAGVVDLAGPIGQAVSVIALGALS
jgi:hypothetical protein